MIHQQLQKDFEQFVLSRFKNEIDSQQLRLSLGIICLNSKDSQMVAFNYRNSIYPASTAKVFIAAGVLYAISIKFRSLELATLVTIQEINCVDRDFIDVIDDGFPILHAGEVVTIEYLLDRMLIRSDNTAANELIDLVGREFINEHIMEKYGWEGSSITRKYFAREREPVHYQTAPALCGYASHYLEFLNRMHTGSLRNEWVSKEIFFRMLRAIERPEKPSYFSGIPEIVSHARKGGWFKSFSKETGMTNEYISECGIVEEKKTSQHTFSWGYVVLSHQKYKEVPIFLFNESVQLIHEFTEHMLRF